MNVAGVNNLAFSPEFLEWIEGADYSAIVADGRVVVANTGGEVRYYVAFRDREYVLTRADRADAERFLLSTAALIDVERYLTRQVSVVVRSRASYPPLRIPFGESQVAPGFEPIVFADGLTGLKRTTGDVLEVRFKEQFVHPAVQFSYYADADLADLRRSFETPDGAPLFIGFVSEDA